MKGKINLIRSIKLSGILFLVILASLFIGIDVIDSLHVFKNRSEKMRSIYIKQQKDMIKQEVLHVVDMIKQESAKAENLTKSKIKTRVNEVSSIAQYIYEQNKNIKSDAEIKKMIIDAIRPIYFEGGKGYYFISQLDGKFILLANKPEYEGHNLLESDDNEGKKIAQDMVNIAEKYGEGFYEYYWSKPNEEGSNHKKISFIKRFDAFNWFIGTGLYVEDIEDQIKSNLMDAISKIRFGTDGYIFVNRLNGDALVTSGKRLSGTKKLWEIFDIDPVQMKNIYDKELKAALNPDGDFIYYSFIKLSNNIIQSPKTSFIYGIPEFQWLVGAGVYLDDVEKDIAILHSTLNAQIKLKLLYSILITISIATLFLLLLNFITRRLRRDFRLFISFFDRAAISDKAIKIEKIRFKEFARLAKDANRMLEDKMNAQKELLEEKEQLFVTIRSIGDAVITTDKMGKVEMMNTVAENLTAWNIDEAKGEFLSNVFHIINENTGDRAENPVEKVLSCGEIVGLANHTILISRDGTRYHIADSAAPIKDSKSNIRGVVLVFRDVSEQLKTEEELFNAKKLESVGVLAGGIAHDFNNILTGLFGNIELAKLKIDTEHIAYRYLENANNALERATHLTKQLLTFSKGGDPIIEVVDLKTVFETTVKFNLSGSNVKSYFDLEEDLWQVKADKGQINQVVANLTINAKQAMPDGGSLFFKAGNFTGSPNAYLNGDFVKISISDEGIGISNHQLEKIFDPYYTTKQTGSGLGLATVYSIISKHNGYINVESALGAGATFTIFLPADRNDRKKSLNKIDFTSESNINSGRILVMDDEGMIRDLLSRMLKLSGYSSEFAIEGQEAINLFNIAIEEGKPFDLVILDLTIPGGMGGKETGEELLLIDPQIKVIVSSGYSTDPIMANYTKYGFKGRLVKPFKIAELRKELLRVLSEA